VTGTSSRQEKTARFWRHLRPSERAASNGSMTEKATCIVKLHA
jgi:hypothetical protein